jgi:hypothetical protein
LTEWCILMQGALIVLGVGVERGRAQQEEGPRLMAVECNDAPAMVASGPTVLPRRWPALIFEGTSVFSAGREDPQ